MDVRSDEKVRNGAGVADTRRCRCTATVTETLRALGAAAAVRECAAASGSSQRPHEGPAAAKRQRRGSGGSEEAAGVLGGGGGDGPTSDTEIVSADGGSGGGSGASPYIGVGLEVYLLREPCLMCSMALVHSRVKTVVYGVSTQVPSPRHHYHNQNSGLTEMYLHSNICFQC
jgi:hypothetical protein